MCVIVVDMIGRWSEHRFILLYWWLVLVEVISGSREWVENNKQPMTVIERGQDVKCHLLL